MEKKVIPALMQDLEGEPPQLPNACGDGTGGPSPIETSRAAGNLPTRGRGSSVILWQTSLKRPTFNPSFLPHISAGQAEKQCFYSEFYMKNNFLKHVLETAFTCSTNTVTLLVGNIYSHDRDK